MKNCSIVICNIEQGSNAWRADSLCLIDLIGPIVPIASLSVLCAYVQCAQYDCSGVSRRVSSACSKKGFNVRSFGSGTHVKLPGPSPNHPNIYDFNTSYTEMYRDLNSKDRQLYPAADERCLEGGGAAARRAGRARCVKQHGCSHGCPLSCWNCIA